MDKILIVDDLADNLEIIEEILSNDGYNATKAHSGKEAIELCQKNKFVLLLIDTRMPEMNGFETYQEIKNVNGYSSIPALFFVTKNDYENVPKAFAAGGVDIISKPFQRNELLARVSSHLSLYKQRCELQELNATKDRFFSIIAHDLKNPFNALLGFSKLLLDRHNDQTDEEREQLIRFIFEASQNTYALLENLLTWSKAQLKGINYQPMDIVFPELLNDTIKEVRSHARKKSLQIQSPNLYIANVYADKNLLATVLRNLLSNAIKFTRNGGEVVVLTELADSFLEITIKDSGVGIPQSKIDDLFQVDKNVSTQGTDNETGTGLGLILCKEFVERMGGKIWVKSEVNVGSEFIFTVPVHSND